MSVPEHGACALLLFGAVPPPTTEVLESPPKRPLALSLICAFLVACGGAVQAEQGSSSELGEGGSGGSPASSPPGGSSGSGGTGASGGGVCPCSRRPGVNNSSKCAVGVGEATTQLIGPEGGVVALHARQGISSGVDFRVEIPPGMLPVGVEIRITEMAAPPPADLVDFSPIYRVEPVLDVIRTGPFPIKMTVPYGNNDGEVPASLGIYFRPYESLPFEPIRDSYINAGFLQGTWERTGMFLAAHPRTPGQANCP
jgi:hypothetical protein